MRYSLVIKWPNDGTAGHVTIVQQSVKVGQKAVANVEGLSSRSSDSVGPQTGVLIHGVPHVVTAGKGVESAHLHPSFAHLLGRVEDESANVGPDVRHPEHVELHHSND